jgi:hypothetical protein
LSRITVPSNAVCVGCSASSPLTAAHVILGGIELIHMMRKQQAKYACEQQLSLAEQFHLLAA